MGRDGEGGGGEGGVGGQTEYENGINVPTPKGRLHCGNPFGHASLCLGPTTKRGTFYSSRKLVFLLLPGGI